MENNKIKIGIFFGGLSREREISFAGGRTVNDNLDKSLFEPLPVFVDSLGNFILLNWEYIYKGTIRDFYPPASYLPQKEHVYQIYVESLAQEQHHNISEIISSVGKKLEPNEFKSLFDFAFLALHGPYGEDGNIQGLLEWYGIPYSGAGILPSAIGINKIAQKQLMKQLGFAGPSYLILTKNEALSIPKPALFITLSQSLGLPFVVKSPNQGSSIGVSVVNSAEKLEKAINRSLFIEEIHKQDWIALTQDQQYNFVRDLADIRVGIGLPVIVNDSTITHPSDLLRFINKYFEADDNSLKIEAVETEEQILVESFINGKEFSCIVLQNTNGEPLALPPTEIVKENQLFDYRSKYLPGMSRKITPIDLPIETIEKIRSEAVRLYAALQFNVYARIDGFVNENGEVFLNDPNTTSGMLPSSFFFHQAAEIGLNPSQFLTYIIRTSLSERLKTGKNAHLFGQILRKLDGHILKLNTSDLQKIRVAVIMGGYSSERHISVESGRNIYEKLASSAKYEPIPVFLTGDDQEHDLYLIPVNVMLKDNADDIKEKVNHRDKPRHPLLNKISEEAAEITKLYSSIKSFVPKKITYENLAEIADEVFIALHGRPGEDGALQKHLERVGLTYNGSGIKSSSITINKYETNKILRENGVLVANHRLVYQSEWSNPEKTILDIEQNFLYPIIAKPADDGCSSAVKKIKTRDELVAFANMMFRETPEFLPEESKILNLKYKEEFPQKNYFLIEDLIEKKGAKHFLEITGGMLTKLVEGKVKYEVFEPSETLASGEVLSLEEKFLAGEGQNITPARFAVLPTEQERISKSVRASLEKTAQILQVEGYCRIDAFVRIYEDEQVETVIIEINSLPGMTPATCIFHQSAINGYKPYEFIDAILTYGKTKQVAGIHV